MGLTYFTILAVLRGVLCYKGMKVRSESLGTLFRMLYCLRVFTQRSPKGLVARMNGAKSDEACDQA